MLVTISDNFSDLYFTDSKSDFSYYNQINYDKNNQLVNTFKNNDQLNLKMIIKNQIFLNFIIILKIYYN